MAKSLKGIVLAGGKSRRFGKDKALALISGKPMLQRAVDLLQGLGLETCIVTNLERDYSSFSSQIVRDLIPEQGPLGGIYTAFHYFPHHTALILTCDMPLVPAKMLTNLIKAHQETESEAVVFQHLNGEMEPFPGIYGPGVQKQVRECLDSGQLSMRGFLKALQITKVAIAQTEENLLMNINFENDIDLKDRKKV